MILLCKIRDALQILLFSIYNKNLQKPATETYNVSKGFLPPLTTELFQSRNEHPYNLRYVYHFNRPSVNTMCHGTKSISFLWPDISNLLPNKLKKIQSLKAFKNRIKSWKPKKMIGPPFSKVLRFHEFLDTALSFIYSFEILICYSLF